MPNSGHRDLAWDLSRSVFGTTAEVYRLLVRRLLTAVGDPARTSGEGAGEVVGPGPMSFVRAVSVKKGDMMPTPIDAGAAAGDVH